MRNKFDKFVIAVFSGNIGMCLEYYFRVNQSPYPLIISGLSLIIVILNIIKND